MAFTELNNLLFQTMGPTPFHLKILASFYVHWFDFFYIFFIFSDHLINTRAMDSLVDELLNLFTIRKFKPLILFLLKSNFTNSFFLEK